MKFFGMAIATALAAAATTHAMPQHGRRQSSSSGNGYTDPTSSGGSMLTRLNASTNLGEPLNVIISAKSDSGVLTTEGLEEYFESLYFSPGDCGGLSAGGAQQANLGDGSGYRDQGDVLRFNYYQGDTGTCIESIKGGNHLRYFIQNGSSADTGAVFIAASVELSGAESHELVPNGYNLGRNQFVNNATNSSGTTSPGGFQYSASATRVSLLDSVESSNINHGIGVDGEVSVLTVRITKNGTLGAGRTGSTDDSSSGSASMRLSHAATLTVLPGLLVASMGFVTLL